VNNNASCQVCHKSGHQESACPESQTHKNDSCGVCHEAGHAAVNCPENIEGA